MSERTLAQRQYDRARKRYLAIADLHNAAVARLGHDDPVTDHLRVERGRAWQIMENWRAALEEEQV